MEEDKGEGRGGEGWVEGTAAEILHKWSRCTRHSLV